MTSILDCSLNLCVEHLELTQFIDQLLEAKFEVAKKYVQEHFEEELKNDDYR